MEKGEKVRWILSKIQVGGEMIGALTEGAAAGGNVTFSDNFCAVGSLDKVRWVRLTSRVCISLILSRLQRGRFAIKNKA